MRVACAVLVAFVLAGCGATTTRTVVVTTERTVTETVSGASGVTTSPESQKVTIFLLRDGKVAPVTREISPTQAVGAAALRELARGQTDEESAAGISTAVPVGADLQLSIDNGTATVVGPEGLSDPAAAQIVYTLTQFPSVTTVRVNGGNAGDRAGWERLTPPILVLTPTPGQTVTSPLRVAGTANTFEATLQLELRDAAGAKLAEQTVTATSGSGTRGTFEAELPFSTSASNGKLVAFESSAENGQPIHVVEIPLRFGP